MNVNLNKKGRIQLIVSRIVVYAILIFVTILCLFSLSLIHI